jgi:transposase
MLVDFRKHKCYNLEKCQMGVQKLIMEELLKMLDGDLKYLSHEIVDDTFKIYAESARESAICPYCGESSDKVHSRYLRKMQDLPIQGKKSKIILRNKKFFCVNPNCSHKTFAEMFTFFKPKATKTERLQDEIFQISLSQSSLAASQHLRRSIANVGKSTICNLIKQRGGTILRETT